MTAAEMVVAVMVAVVVVVMMVNEIITMAGATAEEEEAAAATAAANEALPLRPHNTLRVCREGEASSTHCGAKGGMGQIVGRGDAIAEVFKNTVVWYLPRRDHWPSESG